MTDQPSSTPTKTHEVFLKNMAAFWQTDAELALRIDEIPDEARWAVEATRSGQWTTAAQITAGQKAYLHSRYDPEAEAVKLADGVDLEGNYCFVINGFGLGYLVRELYGRLKGEAFLIVIEPSLELLSTALACVDVSELISSGRMILLVEADKSRLHEKLGPRTPVMLMGLQFVSHPPSERVAGEFHAAMRKAITDYVAYMRTTMVTLMQNAEITCRNIAYNLPTYLATPPVDILKERFAGCPGVVIAAGPSLRRQFDLLARFKGRAVLCAVQTMFGPLLRRGIIPDFVSSLDFHEMSRRYFQGVDDFHGVHLVAEPKCTWHVVDMYRGPVSLIDANFAHLLVGSELAARGALRPGASVAHLCFYLAQYMGCDPIIFVGQDLGYTGHVFYVPGVDVHRTWTGEINRFNTMETREWERIVRNRTILRKVEDLDGRPLYTDELLFTYLEQFEKDIATCRAQVIDATEGGARIRGTEVMPLAEVFDRFCADPISGDRFEYRETTQWYDASRLPAAREHLERQLDEVREVQRLCEEFLTILAELKELVHDPPRFNRRLVRVDELRSRMREHDLAYRIINAVSQRAEMRRFTADRQLETEGLTGAERALRQLERDVEFVSETKDGAERVIGILTGTIERLDAELARGERPLR